MKLMKIARRAVAVAIGTIFLAGPSFAVDSASSNANVDKSDKESRYASSKRVAQSRIEALHADKQSLLRQARSINLMPLPVVYGPFVEDPYAKARRLEDESLLRICKKYNHCDCQIADQLHCYQLESMLIKLNAPDEKAALATPTNTSKSIEVLSDLKVLYWFGTPANTRYIAPFGGGSK